MEDGRLRIGNAVYSAVICGEGALFTKASVREQAVVSGIWYEEAQWKWRYMGHGGNQFLLEGKENCISREDADRNEAGRERTGVSGYRIRQGSLCSGDPCATLKKGMGFSLRNSG